MRYWKRVDQDGKTTTVESYSHDLNIKRAIEISEGEFLAFIASLPQPVEQPKRDYLGELDALRARIETLETK